MLVFIDESGDSGFKFDRGSSQFFVVAIVIFVDPNEALVCDQRITGLKRELGWTNADEFHFKENSHTIRLKIFGLISTCRFKYYSIVINKQAIDRSLDFNTYIADIIQNTVGHLLGSASITLDQGNAQDFGYWLKGKVKNSRMNKIKRQRSSSNNLLQLADYVAGAIHRSFQPKKKHSNKYRQLIVHREILVHKFPK